MSVWQPLIDRGDGAWVGATEEPGIWVGPFERPNARIDLRSPVFLWPLLERPVEQVRREFTEVWSRFRVPDLGPEQVLASVIVSALRLGGAYWKRLGMDWLQVLPVEGDRGTQEMAEALSEVARGGMPQDVRHRARRLARQVARAVEEQ